MAEAALGAVWRARLRAVRSKAGLVAPGPLQKVLPIGEIHARGRIARGAVANRPQPLQGKPKGAPVAERPEIKGAPLAERPLAERQTQGLFCTGCSPLVGEYLNYFEGVEPCTCSEGKKSLAHSLT